MGDAVWLRRDVVWHLRGCHPSVRSRVQRVQVGTGLPCRLPSICIAIARAVSIAFTVGFADIASALAVRLAAALTTAAFTDGPTPTTATLRLMVRRSFRRLGCQVHHILRMWRLPSLFVASLPAAIASAIATSLRVSIAATVCTAHRGGLHRLHIF